MFIRETLQNGIPVVMETVDGVRSACIGIWVKVGSRNESASNNGISHFLEHMFFRGTPNRTSKEIAMSIDSLGGELNAFTTRECTTFYAKTLDEHLEIAVELLADIFNHSLLEQEDIQKEKNIIIEEVKGLEDTPEDYIHELFNNTIWGDSPLGFSILGPIDTLVAFSRENLIEFIDAHYYADNIVISVAGHFEPEKMLRILNSSMGSVKNRLNPPKYSPAPPFMSAPLIHYRELQEVHICQGYNALPAGHEKRYCLYLLNAIVGSGMSSRLFQEIREKQGLAYTVYSFLLSYFDAGVFAVYAATSKENAGKVIELIGNELSLVKNDITAPELQRAKEQLKGNLILGMESTTSRMGHNARQEIYLQRHDTPADIIADIEKVTLDEILEMAETLFNHEQSALTTLGPLESASVKDLPYSFLK
jgi:predicted Zn-dependent peptidase